MLLFIRELNHITAKFTRFIKPLMYLSFIIIQTRRFYYNIKNFNQNFYFVTHLTYRCVTKHRFGNTVVENGEFGPCE